VIAVSFDVDWVPDAVLADTLELLAGAGVRATFFATHVTPLLRHGGEHEVGLHPNFLPTKDFAGELNRLLAAYPEAEGVRSHSYYQNSHILNLFVKHGLRYDSNIMMVGCPGIRPFRHYNGLIRLPVFWEDDVHALAPDAPWDPDALPLDDPDALYVFSFHPIHVFLNTERLDRYEQARAHYQDANRLRAFVNPESSGVGTRVFLRRLLRRLRGAGSATLAEVTTA
jgi:polysaccharide deactylase WbmS-like protein